MTQQEIIDGNKLISAFMGKYYHEGVYVQDYKFYSSDPEGGGVGFSRKVNCYSIHETLALKECDAPHHHECPDIVDQYKTPIEETESVKYHSSWDWLMPVVEKIEDCKRFDGFGFSFIIDNWNAIIKKCLSGENVVFIRNGKSKMDVVYRAVLQFIQWCNSLSK